MILERPHSQQRVDVGAVVRMAMADEHRIHVVGTQQLQQLRHDGVAGIDEQLEGVVLEEVPAARTAGCWPTASSA